MSMSGWFTCLDCRVTLSLGRAVRGDGTPGRVVRFQYPAASDDPPPPNWAREDKAKVVWKMFADHLRHRIELQLDPELAEADEEAPIRRIGGATIDDISDEDYLREPWPPPK